MSEPASCPIRFSAGIFGDAWSLLILRDLALKGRHSYMELLAGGEGIARNILSARLKKLQAAGVVDNSAHPTDGRRRVYRLTERGKDLIPVLVELVVWGATYDPESTVPSAWLREAREDRDSLIARLRDNA